MLGEAPGPAQLEPEGMGKADPYRSMMPRHLEEQVDFLTRRENVRF